MVITLKKIGIKSYDPTIPLLNTYPEETITEKDTCIPMVTAALCTIAGNGSNLDVYGHMNG